MMIGFFVSLLLLVMAVFMLIPLRASAHCDTMDGPTAKDGQTALKTGNINYALKWILPDDEAEIRGIFELSLSVRAMDPQAKELADRYFLENLVRVHRAAEGAPYTGLKPLGTPIEPKVAAADKCIEVGNLSPLKGLVDEEEMHELEEFLDKALSLKEFDVNDLEKAREYIGAYVRFFKTAEGEGHDEVQAAKAH